MKEEEGELGTGGILVITGADLFVIIEDEEQKKKEP